MDMNNNAPDPGQGGYVPDPNLGDEPIRRAAIHIDPNMMLYTTSMVLGIISIATAILGTVYLPFMLGGIAIVMAIASRPESGPMHMRARIGILCAVIGIVVNVAVVGTTVYTVMHDPEQFEMFDSVFEKVYGEDFSSFMEEQGITVPIPE